MSQAIKEESPPAGHNTELCSRLVEICDDLSEVISLNFFLYDAFLGIVVDDDSLPLEPNTLAGLSIISRWLRSRQRDVKNRLRLVCGELGAESFMEHKSSTEHIGKNGAVPEKVLEKDDRT